MKERDYEYWIAGIMGVDPAKRRLLRESVKTAEEVYYMEEKQMRKMRFLTEGDCGAILKARRQEDFGEAAAAMEEKGIRLITFRDPEYPKSLLEIPDPPYAVYVKGALPEEGKRRAAVIGARRCTPYGEKYAIDFGRVLAEHGVDIISGMARGIDGMGHRGALLGKGKTYAVLGSGADVCYPREHIGLYVDILEQGGGILSEQPPGTPPLPKNFPSRNRIISGLSDAVLVMEAGEKSGSLITVDFALEQGKDVYALPGPVNSILSNGCNSLIRQGAGILLSPEDLLREWEPGGIQTGTDDPDAGAAGDKIEKVLESEEKLVYACLGLFPKGIGQIAAETKMEARAVTELLVSLQLGGHIREISKNQYIRS